MAGTGKFFVGGNWKCNETKDSITQLVADLNSAKLEPDVGLVSDMMKEIVQTALRMFNAQHGSKRASNAKWIFIECPTQKNVIDCGYYVMRFMKEITKARQRVIPTQYFHAYNGREYNQVEIDEIREEWATYVIQHIGLIR